MAKLKVLSGENTGKEFSVEHLTANIGRDPSNDIVLDEPSLSRLHAQIRKEDDRYEIIDQGSSNGTMVNERRVASCELKDGDSIKLGEVELVFCTEETAVDEGATTPETAEKIETKPAAGKLEKADPLKRLLAYLVDGAAVFVFIIVVNIIAHFLGIFRILILAAPAYFLLRDGIFKQFRGQSLGKKVLKIVVVNVDTKQPIDWLGSLKRQIFMAIPILNFVECILLLTDPDGRRLGDKIADTMVVKAE